MKTSVVNVKVKPEIKKQAQKVAEELGFSLSSLVNGYLKDLVRTKTVKFSLEEEPTEYFLESLKEAEEDIKAGRVVSFDDTSKALKFLDNLIEKEQKLEKN